MQLNTLTFAVDISAVKWYISLRESHEIIASQTDTNAQKCKMKGK